MNVATVDHYELWGICPLWVSGGLLTSSPLLFHVLALKCLRDKLQPWIELDEQDMGQDTST